MDQNNFIFDVVDNEWMVQWNNFINIFPEYAGIDDQFEQARLLSDYEEQMQHEIEINEDYNINVNNNNNNNDIAIDNMDIDLEFVPFDPQVQQQQQNLIYNIPVPIDMDDGFIDIEDFNLYPPEFEQDAVNADQFIQELQEALQFRDEEEAANILRNMHQDNNMVNTYYNRMMDSEASYAFPFWYSHSLGFTRYVFATIIGHPILDTLGLAWSPSWMRIYSDKFIQDVTPDNTDPLQGTVWLDPYNPDSPRPDSSVSVAFRQFYDNIIFAANKMNYWYMNPDILAGTGLGRDKNLYKIVIRFYNPADMNADIEYRDIALGEIQTYEEFAVIIGQFLTQGRLIYDDIIDEEAGELVGYYVDTTIFDIKFADIPMIQSQNTKRREYIIYKTILQEDNGRCIYNSLKQCGYDKLELYSEKSVDKLLALIKRDNLPVSIIYNIPTKPLGAPHHMRPALRVRIRYMGGNRAKSFWPLKDIHIETNYMYKAPIESHILVWDVKRGHIEKISTALPELLDNIFMNDHEIVKRTQDNSFILIRNYITIKKPNIDVMSDEDVVFIFFDFEGVPDIMDEFACAPYSCSFTPLNLTQLAYLNELEDNYNETEAKSFIGCNINNFVGYNCVELMLSKINNMISNDQHDKKTFIMVGFNNSQYDNFCLLNALHGMAKINEQAPIKYVEYQKTRISNILFFHKVSTLDMKRHLTTGSLKSLCKDIGIKNFRKKDELISHAKVQYLMYKHGKEGFLDALDKEIGLNVLLEYNTYDVLSLAVLFFRYHVYMKQFECFERAHQIEPKLKPVYLHCSLPSYMYAVHNVLTKAETINIPTLEYYEYSMIHRASIASRVDTFGNDKQKITENVISADLTSAFPSAMFVWKDCDYPTNEFTIGNMTFTLAANLHMEYIKFQRFLNIAWYHVTIDQSILVKMNKSMIICHKSDEGHDWSYDDRVVYQENIPLCTIDIEELLKHGCNVEFVFDKFYIIFTHRVTNFKLFGWLSEFMKVKNDMSKVLFDEGENSENYNKTIAKLVKLCPNSLYGKMMQHPFESVSVQLKAHDYYSWLTRTKDMEVGSSNVIGFAGIDKVIVTYKKTKESIKFIKPCYIGCCITAYVRRYIYNIMYRLGQQNLLYMDTDSILVKRATFEMVLRDYIDKTLIPVNDEVALLDERYKTLKIYEEKDKIFGGFSNELVPKGLYKNNLTYINGKKEKGIFRIDRENNILGSAVSFKGVKQNSIVLFDVTGDEEQLFVKMSMNNKMYVYDQIYANEFDIDNRDALGWHDPKNIRRVFELLISNRPVFIMNSVFLKDLEKTKVRILYLIKKLQ